MYESRILASHHALLSTYALETMVLYILNHHHSTVTTPLQVLHKFLKLFRSADCALCSGLINLPLACSAQQIRL